MATRIKSPVDGPIKLKKASMSEDDTVTFIVKLPFSLRKTVKMLAARENITINDFFLRAVQVEVATVMAQARGEK